MAGVLDVLRGVGKVAGNAATVAGAGFHGYGQDQDNAVAKLLKQQQEIRAARRDDVLNAISQRDLTRVGPGDPGYGQYKAGEIAATAPAATAAKVADIRATAQPTADAKATEIATTSGPAANAAAELDRARIAPAVDRQTALAPGAVKQASDIATAQIPIRAREAENAAAAAERHAPPIPVANKDGSQTLVRRSDAVGQQKGAGQANANQSLRSLSQVFAAGSGIGAVKEMAATHPNLKAFEQRFLDPTLPPASLTALDRFRTRLAQDIQTHGYISSAVASEAERELASTNPDLVVYGRNLKQWVAGDLNVSKSSTDERQRLDMAVSGLSVPLSSMPIAQRQEFIHQMWEAREGRLAGLQTAAETAQKMLDDRTGKGKATTTPQGVATPEQKLWDAAVAKHGEAKVLQSYGPRPP